MVKQILLGFISGNGVRELLCNIFKDHYMVLGKGHMQKWWYLGLFLYS